MRVYAPLMLRPWVMDRTHKEAVHLGEKITLAMLERGTITGSEWLRVSSGGSGDATPARFARRREIRYDGL